MFFHTLTIKNFRCFTDKSIRLGKYVTVLAGRNSTGKSTVLGMLGNSAETKKSIGCTYFSKQFRAEFSELFKGSKDHDPTGADKFRLSLADDTGTEVEYRHFRVAWQSPRKAAKKCVEDKPEQGKQRGELDKESLRTRFRVIPTYKDDDGKLRERKFELPVYYLGLSRLFPIGEAKDDNLRPTQMQFETEAHEEWFIDKYRKILYLDEDIQGVSGISIGETENKRAVGVNTSTYDYLSNSAGQDNLGQILMALLSFKQIHFHLSPWKGGLLLIDELDATLHPSAQNELFDVMFRTAKELDIQIVFTTHSISLLKHISGKIRHNNDDKNNEIELYYFTRKNRRLEIVRNSNIADIEGDLTVQSIIQSERRIPLYAEDDEARWFFRNLASQYLTFISMPDVSLGYQELLRLLEGDVQYFGNTIMLFDGDVSDNFIDSNKIAKRTGNIIKLPGVSRPEQVIFKYILDLQSRHPFWKACEVMQFSWDYFKQHGPDSYQGNEREKYKKWFQEHQQHFDSLNLYSFWAADNPTYVNEFLAAFKTAYNTIAERLSLPQI